MHQTAGVLVPFVRPGARVTLDLPTLQALAVAVRSMNADQLLAVWHGLQKAQESQVLANGPTKEGLLMVAIMGYCVSYRALLQALKG